MTDTRPPMKSNIKHVTNKPPKFNVTNRAQIDFGNSFQTNNQASNMSENNFFDDPVSHERSKNSPEENYFQSVPSNPLNPQLEVPENEISPSDNPTDHKDNFEKITKNPNDFISYQQETPNPIQERSQSNHNEIVHSENLVDQHNHQYQARSTNMNEQTLIELEIEREKSRVYLKEINELREINTDLKLKLSKVNEEHHQLEIKSYQNRLALKDREIELLQKEKTSLKEQLAVYERFLKKPVEQNIKQDTNPHEVHDHVNYSFIQDFKRKPSPKQTPDRKPLTQSKGTPSENNTNRLPQQEISLNHNLAQNNDNHHQNLLPNNLHSSREEPKRSRFNSSTSNQDEVNKSNVSNEQTHEKKVTLPPKINESYKLNSKGPHAPIINRVPVNLQNINQKNESVATTHKNEENLDSKLGSNNPFFDDEGTTSVQNSLFEAKQSPSVHRQPPQILNKITVPKQKESQEQLVKGSEQRQQQEKVERKGSDSQSEGNKVEQGTFSSVNQMNQDHSIKNNLFDDENDSHNEFMNKSHVASSKNKHAPIHIHPKILTPSRENKKNTPATIISKIEPSQNNDIKNNLFDDGEEIGNLFETTSKTTKNTKTNIPLNRPPIISANKTNLPLSKNKDKNISPNVSVLKQNENRPIVRPIQNTVPHDPFNFSHNENDFDNIFDSLSSSTTSKQKQANPPVKSNTYFDD